MKNKPRSNIELAILMVSAIVFFSFCARSNIKILAGGLFGALICAILWHIKAEIRQSVHPGVKTSGLIVSILICLSIMGDFLYSCSTSSAPSILYNFVLWGSDMFSVPFDMAVKIFGIGFAIISLPFVYYAIVKGIVFIMRCWNCIDLSVIREKVLNKATAKSACFALASSVAAILLSAMIGLVLLVGAYSLPVDAIDKNVASSARMLEREGPYPRLFAWCQSTLDNFTDSLMMLEAANASDDSALNRAILAYSGRFNDYDPNSSLVLHYKYGLPFDYISTYARYWHGYHIFLKPLLSIVNYQFLRNINTIVQLVCVLIVCYLLLKRNMRSWIVPYLLSYLMLMPLAIGKSLQFSSCFYIMSFGVTAILLLNKGNKFLPAAFLGIGIAVAYFDFLTYPIVTLGIPALIYLSMHNDNCLEDKLLFLLKAGLLWCIGYVGMWSSKWILASFITDQNVVSSGLQAVSSRTSSIEGWSVFSCIFDIGVHFFFTPFSVLVLLYILRIARSSLYGDRLDDSNTCTILLPYVMIGLLPFFWYAFARNHSLIHTFFTNKALVVSIAAIMFGLVDLAQNNKISIAQSKIQSRKERKSQKKQKKVLL